ncbi:hypothetical protein IAD21_05200 [Abditibacteriota bacterium]|nr:hypothetical protein IAD21_05200 [Abditibacteriota bacterium]
MSKFSSFSWPRLFLAMLFLIGLWSGIPLIAQQPPMAPTVPPKGAVDVTPQVKALVHNNTLSVVAETALAGVDPARKIVKKLVVIYTAGAQQKVIVVTEGETVRIAALPGDTLSIKKALYGDIAAPVVDVNALLMTNYPAAPGSAKEGTNIFLPRPQLQITPVQPVRVEKRGDIYFADFGAAAFGNLQITLPDNAPAATLSIRLGEKLNDDDSIDRKPPGSVNFIETSISTRPGQKVYQTQIPLKKGPQSGDSAVKTPSDIGNITPFRYVEIEGSPIPLTAASLRQLFVHTAFNDDASEFHSSDETLNAVWNLCKHTMKATTAFGVYIDGERERRPYEADAYINFLSHMATDFNPEVGRYSVEYLLAHPTWPTEWSFHMPMMVEAEYEATGDTALAARNYEALKKKLLMDKARADGLLQSTAIVDWPQGERDNYNEGKTEGQQVGPQINTVANAFYFHALQNMATLARALKKDDDAREFDAKAAQVLQVFNEKLFNPARGLYVDGEGSIHTSLHANMFPLTFGLVPQDRQAKVTDFVQSRGMACSVYGAQYLLEALYKAGRDDDGLKLMTARDERSWWNMIRLGSTMTMEAWDPKFKGNLTWSHPWGAAPANIIARFLVGVRPLRPGYEQILIAPRPGTLQSFQAKVPTPHGPVTVNFDRQNGFQVTIEVPPGTSARVSLPVKVGTTAQVQVDKKQIATTTEQNALVVENVGPGRHIFEMR